jgi:hypothetical protein
LPPIEVDEISDERFAFVAIHENGFIRVEQDEFEKAFNTVTNPNAAAIQLEPWAELEGTLLVGGKPGEGMMISFDKRDHDFGEKRDLPRIDIYDSVKTDANGRFTFRKVASGDYTLSRMIHIPTGGGMSMSFSLKSMPISIQSGEKQTVTFGGTVARSSAR